MPTMFCSQVIADTLTLGLMVYASILNPAIPDDKTKIDLIYVGCMFIQVKHMIVLLGFTSNVPHQ